MKRLLFFHTSWCPSCRFYEKQFIEPIEERVGIDKLLAIVLLADEAVYMKHTGIINVEKVVGWMKNIEM